MPDEHHTEPAYPKREDCFAIHFVKDMKRAGLGNQVGAECCWLLTIIVMREDAILYSGPVEFYAAQLAAEVGFSVSSLERARSRAVEAGWLHFKSGGRRRAGTYWVTSPAAAVNRQNNRQADGQTANNRQFNRQPDASVDGTPFLDPPKYKKKEAAPSPAVLEFLCAGKEQPVWKLTQAKLDEWRETFDTIDVLAELRAAKQWGRDNPKKRKLAEDMERHLYGWLNDARRKAAARNGKPHRPASRPANRESNVNRFIRRRAKP